MKTNIFQLVEAKRPFFATSSFHAGLEDPQRYIFEPKQQLLTNQTVKFSAIKGQWKPDSNSTWMQKLLSLNKLQENLRLLQSNPDYYFNDEVKQPKWVFVKVGEDYYIKKGINRTVLARFLAFYNPERFAKRCEYNGYNNIAAISGVDVIVCNFAEEAMNTLASINRLLEKPKFKHLKLINTKPLLAEPEYQLFNKRLKERKGLLLTVDQLPKLLEQMQNTNLFSRFTGDNLTRFIAS